MTITLKRSKKGQIMTTKNDNRYVIKSPTMLPRIVTGALIFMLLLLINIDTCSYIMNHNSYEKTTATVTKTTTDTFLLFIPKVELTYEYNGAAYNESKFFILRPLWGFSSQESTKIPIYVNRYAPNHSLFQVNFCRNILNWFLLILMAVDIYDIVQRHRKKRENANPKKEVLP